ncbi:hypothetical protein BE08_23265 [Sorangium cellulosum]|uniref:Uncharacterized protein n=1 Tax=Sorangium cellulosum TaxID=56 RepID=A0A150PPL5_SORCE|nr:hypothetical protein BE08_23265 [Sorangium cellulosum]
MVTVPLSTDSYADKSDHVELRHQLHHGPTREVMRYLVSCALAPGQEVKYHDTLTSEDYTFKGEMGLCPDWADNAASVECQELVTACLLVRNNALGKKVAISMRGEVPGVPPGEDSPPLLYPQSVVSTVVHAENGNVIASFKRCASPEVGAGRDCGWKPAHVGKCAPGQQVHIGAGANPPGRCEDPSVLGSSSRPTVLRVCDGIRGCNSTTPNFIDHSEGSCGSDRPALTFTCPNSGYFSVMSGPRASGGPGEATPEVLDAAGLAVYPAEEIDVFKWPEGAFYGNLWGSGALHPGIANDKNIVTSEGFFDAAPAVIGSVFRRAFTCTGRFWTRQEAYMADRVCAGGVSDCAATWVGACDVANSKRSIAPRCPRLYRCASADGAVVPGDGDFDDCQGRPDEGPWSRPITVFLNNPTDIVSDPMNSETMGTPDAPGDADCR